jgi:hypothetical protein
MKSIVPLGERKFGELTPMQQAFVTHPAVLSDPVRAARESGYTEIFATTRSYSLRKELNHVIMSQETAQAGRQAITPAEVINELTAAALANMLDYFELMEDANGTRLMLKQNLKALPLSTQRQIKKLEFDTTVLPDGTLITVVSKIELHDRTWALKEFVEIMRLRQGAPPADASELLKHMSADELETVENIYRKAAERAGEERKDRDAIETR